VKAYTDDRREAGFTLIELLIAIVVVGVLAAVAIVGINGLTNKGENSSCQATKDAARAAVAVHYANNDGAYPSTFQQMIDADELNIADNVTVGGADKTLSANGWTVTLGTGGAVTANGTNGACP
jgi:general secretion pathway protein G